MQLKSTDNKYIELLYYDVDKCSTLSSSGVLAGAGEQSVLVPFEGVDLAVWKSGCGSSPTDIHKIVLGLKVRLFCWMYGANCAGCSNSCDRQTASLLLNSSQNSCTCVNRCENTIKHLTFTFKCVCATNIQVAHFLGAEVASWSTALAQHLFSSSPPDWEPLLDQIPTDAHDAIFSTCGKSIAGSMAAAPARYKAGVTAAVLQASASAHLSAPDASVEPNSPLHLAGVALSYMTLAEIHQLAASALTSLAWLACHSQDTEATKVPPTKVPPKSTSHKCTSPGICSAVAACKALQSLELRCLPLHVLSASELPGALAQLPFLRELAIDDRSSSPPEEQGRSDHVKAVAAMLTASALPAVTKLDLDLEDPGTPRGLLPLLQALPELPALAALLLNSRQDPAFPRKPERCGDQIGTLHSLRHLRCGAGAAPLLSALLQAATALSSLTIHGQVAVRDIDIGDALFHMALVRPGVLKTLNAEFGCVFGTSAGTWSMHSALRHLTGLQRLRVDVGHEAVYSMSPIVSAIGACSALQALSLLNFGSHHGAQVASMLEDLTQLAALHLQEARVSRDDAPWRQQPAAVILRSVGALANLQRLSVVSHHADDDAPAEAEVFQALLEGRPPCLQVLEYENRCPDRTGGTVAHAAAAAPQLPALTRLSLHVGACTDDDTAALLRQLPLCAALSSVDVRLAADASKRPSSFLRDAPAALPSLRAALPGVHIRLL